MKTGELKNIGTHHLGMTTYEYYECVDCKTAYPVIRGFPSCNGERIGRCPYCKPQHQNNLCDLPGVAITKQRNHSMKITKFEDCVEGMKVKAVLGGRESTIDGVITIKPGTKRAWLLHNDKNYNGHDCSDYDVDKKGFAYSWIIFTEHTDSPLFVSIVTEESVKDVGEGTSFDTTKAELIYKLGGILFTKDTINDKQLATLQSELTNAESRIVYLKKLLATHAKLFPTKE